MKWQNWSGRLASQPAAIEVPQTEAAVVTAVRDAQKGSGRLQKIDETHEECRYPVAAEVARLARSYEVLAN